MIRKAAVPRFPLTLSLLASLTLQYFIASTVLSEPAPAADEILASVRMQQSRQQIDLEGQLRQEEVIVPFHLTQNGPVIRYIFSNPDQTLQLQLGDKTSRLDEISRSGIEKLSPAQLDRKIRGTNVAYEDLSLKFLYWRDAQVLGSERVRSRDCWKLQLRPPSRQSQYSNVLLWVDKESGALMRMEGYNWEGLSVKRFEVVSAQKINGRWFLKQMRIEQVQPGTNHVLSRTYLEIKK